MSNMTPGDDPGRAPAEPVVQALSAAECLQLVAGQDIGRIAFTGRFGLTVLPVNYRLHDGSIVFRTGQDSPMDTDLRTGLEHGEYQVAFEVDVIDASTREGWSVLIHGPAHHVTTAEERAEVARAGVVPWTGGPKEQFIRILPTQISGRRIRNPGRT
jgi:nitroimidazol reductase NimA-like FMN-containing flavoprotein (pyridoxamine 5'-phosphate oxidase superfamily)